MQSLHPIFWRAILGALVIASGIASAAPETTSARLTSVVAQAPAMQAARLRVDAARARLGAAGKFPDPRVEGMASRASNSMEGSWPKYEARLQQPLPKAGERGADKDRARAAVAMAEADFAMMAGEMAADTMMAVAEAEAANAKAALLDAQIERIQQVLASVEARIASGQGRVADRLALQSRAASMRLMAGKERLMAKDSQCDARARLGLAPKQPLPAFAIPDIARVTHEGSPAARQAIAKSDEAAAMLKMARASAKPMTAIGIQASRELMPTGNEDMVGIALMMEIPWNSRRYARADEAAAAADQAAASADNDVAGFKLEAAIARVDRAARLAGTARRLATETSARLDAEYAGLVRAAAASGAMGADSTVLMILEILEKQADTQWQVIEADAAHRAAAADLWKYTTLIAPPTATPDRT